eukprot:g28006.t3
MVSVPPTGGLSAEDDLDRTPLARQVQGLDSGRTVEDADRVPVDAPVRSGQEEEEEIFEIRDFTNASSFERLSHQISLASKHWAAASRAATTGASGASEEVLQMKDGFELGGFRSRGEDARDDASKELMVPSAPGINNHNIDLDSARTLLSAAVLATAAVPLRPRLSCFVPVEGGRKRVLGEALHGRRTIYCTDLHSSVQPSLEHLAGLSDFFRRKVEAEPCTMMVGVRFTYSADHFDTWQVDGEEGEDAIESMKLHCLWPAFPLGAFVDDARLGGLITWSGPPSRNFSELDPRSAPYWKLRLLRRSAGAAGGATAPRTARLEALLGFRREAKQIRSAEQSMHSQARVQWDALEAPSADSAMATTSRLDASARTELFDSSMCLAQQKMELLERSIRAKTSSAALSAPSARAAQGSFVSRNGRRNCVVPSLLCPALLTEDLRLQRQMAAAGLAEQSAERAELSLGKEMQADVAAFKAENMEADLEDFLQWREEIEGLSNGGFPRAWLEKLWEQTDPKLASEQQKRLFDPFRDAEMALHYLESIEGPQLLLQLFRELSDEMAEAGNPTYLRVLRDRVVSTSLQAFRWKSKEDQEEERLLGIFESLPLAKEFVLQLQPCETSNTHRMRRMYAEVRENHMRLALVRELSFS